VPRSVEDARHGERPRRPAVAAIACAFVRARAFVIVPPRIVLLEGKGADEHVRGGADLQAALEGTDMQRRTVRESGGKHLVLARVIDVTLVLRGRLVDERDPLDGRRRERCHSKRCAS
jgi:hypothetical protein